MVRAIPVSISCLLIRGTGIMVPLLMQLQPLCCRHKARGAQIKLFSKEHKAACKALTWLNDSLGKPSQILHEEGIRINFFGRLLSWLMQQDQTNREQTGKVSWG